MFLYSSYSVGAICNCVTDVFLRIRRCGAVTLKMCFVICGVCAFFSPVKHCFTSHLKKNLLCANETCQNSSVRITHEDRKGIHFISVCPLL